MERTRVGVISSGGDHSNHPQDHRSTENVVIISYKWSWRLKSPVPSVRPYPLLAQPLQLSWNTESPSSGPCTQAIEFFKPQTNMASSCSYGAPWVPVWCWWATPLSHQRPRKTMPQFHDAVTKDRNAEQMSRKAGIWARWVALEKEATGQIRMKKLQVSCYKRPECLRWKDQEVTLRSFNWKIA